MVTVAMSRATTLPAASTDIEPLTPKALNALAEVVRSLNPDQTLIINQLDWDAYEHLLNVRDTEGRSSLRMSFDRGRLEVMTVSSIHEGWKKILARMVEAMAEELNVPFLCAGNLTVRRKDLARGFEPDESYYLGESAGPMHKIRGSRAIDFTRDPAPDLAIEVEISDSISERLPLYAAMKVQEIWRFNGVDFKVLNLQSDENYQEVTTFRYFPTVSPSEIERFLKLSATLEDLPFIRQFREYLRTLASK